MGAAGAVAGAAGVMGQVARQAAPQQMPPEMVAQNREQALSSPPTNPKNADAKWWASAVDTSDLEQRTAGQLTAERDLFQLLFKDHRGINNPKVTPTWEALTDVQKDAIITAMDSMGVLEEVLQHAYERKQ